jgi:hypothetical protein
LVVALAAGCHPRQAPRSQDGTAVQPVPTPAPTTPAVTEFASRENGVRLSYPAGWKPVAGPDEGFILWLTPAAARAGTDAQAPAVSLEVPKLPRHIPGLIPLGSVVGGYLDDLKKQHPGVKVENPADTKVAGANARRVSATWDENGASHTEDAVLTVHGDRVYIFRGNAAADQMGRVRPVLEQVVNAVRWE